MPIKIDGSVVGILSRHGTMKIPAHVVRVDPKTSSFQQPIEAEGDNEVQSRGCRAALPDPRFQLEEIDPSR